MSRVFILRFEKTGGPGYFARYLDRQGISHETLEIDQGEAVPDSIDGVAGLCLLGGVMSANDDHLPWVPQVLALIRQAQEHDVPILGHCLGGQLIARAIGGTVSRSPSEEIGWLPVEVLHDVNAFAWCRGLPAKLTVFQWHNETFSVPPGGHKLFHGETCPNQGFRIGNTLGLQFHLEVLPATVEQWTSLYLDESHEMSDTVQSRETMTEDLPEKARHSHEAADRIYSHWCKALV